ncbi:phage tail tape measure protein [Streptosporangium sp. G11]|uniref:phage tail tape measure protein n=1 Tax=Streptosporangium sp. G11 TaxID=3436926 RepID=UPI003EB9C41B
MSLSLGELHAIIDADDAGFDSAVNGAEKSLKALQSGANTALASLESTVTQSLGEVAASLADGFDPTAALADADRLVAGFVADLDRMEAEAAQGGRGIVNELRTALGDVDDVARQAGQDGGDGLVAGLRASLADAKRVAREAGDDAGREFGDGTEQTGRARMGGAADGLMSSLKSAPWLAAGAAIGAALMSGLTSALDAEQAKAKLFAQVGATGDEMDKLGRVAGKVYADGYGEGIGDVTESLKSVVQNIDGVRDASDEALGTLSKRALDAATILDEDLGRVTAAVSQMLRTGVAKNAEEAFDIIVRGQQLGLNKSEDLLDSFNEYGTQLRTLGLDGKTSLGLISQLLKGGARDSDVAADALKEFAIEAVQGGEKVRSGLANLGFSADDMISKFAKGGPAAAGAFDQMVDKLRNVEDPVKRNAIAVELFGTKAEDLGKALFSLDPSKATASLGFFSGAAKKAGDTLHDTATNKIEQWKRGMSEGVVNFLGGTVLPALEKAAEGFSMSGALEAVQGWKDQLGLIWDGVVADVQEWVAANGETIEQWKTKLSEGFESAKTVVSDVLTILKELWDKYGQDIIAAVTFLVSTFLSIWNGFWGVVSGLVKTAKAVMTGDFTLLKEGLRQIWDSLWQMVEDTIKRTLGSVGQIASESWTKLKADATAAWENLKKTIAEKITGLIADVKTIPAKTRAVFHDAGTWLIQAGKDMILGFVNGIKNMAGAAVDAAKSVVKGAVDGVRNLLDEHSPSKVFHLIGENTIQGWINGVLAKGGEAVVAVKKVMAAAKQAAKDSGFGDNRAAIDAALLAAEKKAKAQQQKKTEIKGATHGTSGVALEGGGGFSGGSSWQPGGGGVVINMPNATIREPADIPRLGAQFGFEYTARA